ncbi:PAS domain S-box protein [Paenibacillus thermoaerophilus]|uniref:histidine kinase n=1 Tax=Paenibacillus thermoaerophilus TaxID=1215385 RepID=A0ABW2V095_9BACL|nr:PAS domain S-box protein [Paenibacillus thermoaerophilus]TMV18164.1 PAS domain S-box protein [Paenibacillus thermoaerophilus]
MEIGPDLIRSARQFLQSVPSPVYVIDLNERVLWGNPAFQREFSGKGEPLYHGEVLYGQGGFQLDKISRIPVIDEQDRVIAYTVWLTDGAGQGGADPLRLEAGEHYRMIAENTWDTIVLVDREAVVRYVSPSLRTLVGYGTEDYEGTDAFEIIHPDDRDRVRALFVETIRSGQPTDAEYRLLHPQGHTVYLEARVKPVLDRDGQVQAVVAVVRDITERKKTEQLLENILDNVNAAVWSTDKDFRAYTFCSESIEKICGLPRSEIMTNPIRLHDHIHPEDNAILFGEAKEKLDRGLPIRQLIRLIHIEGETRWGRLIAHPYLNHAGEIERIDGMILDITEKIRSERALEESEQRYKSLFENNLDGVFSIELERFYFVNANRSFETITGIQIDKLADRCFLGLIVDEDHPSVYETIFHVMTQGEPRDIECRITKQEQGEKIVSITFVPIYLSGKLNGIHGIVKDITKRKIEERELIKSEERYKALQQSLNRFSNDLANVMKVSELENRLIEEVKAILQARSVSIEEVPRGQEPVRMCPHDRWVKIGEKQQPVYLRIGMAQPMLKIEEEWLETAVHYVTILYDNLHRIEDLMKRLEEHVTANETPKWMLRLLFKLSEKERASLSSDLHDSVLQDLIIWYRKLESLRSFKAFDKDTQQELSQIEEGLLDAIHQIRITCNELRPPFLLKMGLVESLKSLFSYARMFSNYEIDFSAGQLDGLLNEEQILGIYRIVQELLNNASKHSKASRVTMALTGHADTVCFSYSDNGIGMDLSAYGGSFQHMGIAGIEKRVLSLEGVMELKSAPGEGFHVKIDLPTNTQLKGGSYGNLIGR